MILAVDETIFITTLISTTAIILGGIMALGKLLWNLSSKWTKTSDQLQSLGEEIKDLVILKERDHARIERENEEIKRRIERHEEWHSRRGRK